MTDFGVSGPTRQSLLWLARKMNERRRTDEKRLERLWKVARGIRYK